MFRGASDFNQNIGNWNTVKVIRMGFMFHEASRFNQDISTKANDVWNTSSVTTMASMFQGASDFDQNIGNWNTAGVENMTSMFFNASNFNQDLSNWNVSMVGSSSYGDFAEGAAFSPASNLPSFSP